MSGQRTTNYNTAKIFVFDNRYTTGTYTNDTYDEVTLAAGTIMGRHAASDELKPLDASASDGTQFPVGILKEETVVADGDVVTLTICVSGDVEESLLTFPTSGDDMNTVVSSKTLRDRIGSDTVGIKLVAGTENTILDNQ